MGNKENEDAENLCARPSLGEEEVTN